MARQSARRRRLRGLAPKVVLLLASLFLVTLACELFLRAFMPLPLGGSWRVQTASGLLVNKSHGTARHAAAGRDVVYRFHPPHLRDTPLEPGRTRVLVLGDSYTFGWLLDWQDTHVHRLQAAADRELGEGFHFVDAAAGGWGTAHAVAFAEEIGERIDPDVVLVFMNTDDIGRSLRSGLYELVEGSGGELERRNVPVSRVKRLLNALPGYGAVMERSQLATHVRHAFLSSGRTPVGFERASRDGEEEESGGEDAPVPASPELAGSPDAVPLGQGLFRRLHAWCAERGVPLLVTTCARHSPTGEAGGDEPTRQFMREAPAFFAEEGIPFHDASPAFLALSDAERAALSIPGDGHPTPAGARFIADQTWPFVKRHLVAQRERR